MSIAVYYSFAPSRLIGGIAEGIFTRTFNRTSNQRKCNGKMKKEDEVRAVDRLISELNINAKARSLDDDVIGHPDVSIEVGKYNERECIGIEVTWPRYQDRMNPSKFPQNADGGVRYGTDNGSVVSCINNKIIRYNKPGIQNRVEEQNYKELWLLVYGAMANIHLAEDLVLLSNPTLKEMLADELSDSKNVPFDKIYLYDLKGLWLMDRSRNFEVTVLRASDNSPQSSLSDLKEMFRRSRFFL